MTIADQIEKTDHVPTAEDVAKFLRVSKLTVYKLAKAGRIPAFSHRYLCAI
jgi:hypothetical protein